MNKSLVAVMIVIGCSFNTCFAYEYVFKAKDTVDFYDATSVDTTVISVSKNKTIGIRTTPNAVYNLNASGLIQDVLPKFEYVKKTTLSDVLETDGSIGRLKINAIDLNLKVYEGTTEASMKKGLGHFVSSDYYEGNVCIAGHNRGVNTNFGKLKKLEIGDKITYKTKLGSKNYKITSIEKISADDFSKLTSTQQNKITLITCVENQPMLRLCVQAEEI